MIKKQTVFSVAAMAVLLAGSSGFGIAGAQTSPMATQAQIDLVNQLRVKVQQLQVLVAQYLALRGGAVAGTSMGPAAAVLTRVMDQGLQGNDVRVLQALLAADPAVYPEGLITGYFGSLTARAAARYQAKNGIAEAAGIVGSQTLARLQADAQGKLNLEMAGDGTVRPCAVNVSGQTLPSGWTRLDANGRFVVGLCSATSGGNNPGQLAIVGTAAASVTQNTATITWTTNATGTTRAYYGTSTPLNLMTATNVTGDASATNHTVVIPNLASNTTYYFVAETKDVLGNTVLSPQQSFVTTSATTGGDVTAPVISGLAASSVAPTSVTLSFSANENASVKVYYSTSAPINANTAPSVSGAGGLATSHTVVIPNLASNTTYYFMVEARDAAGNSNVSNQLTVTTSASGSGGSGNDTTPPVVSGVSSSNGATGATTIVWVTNESATSKVYFSTTSPVNTSSSTSIAESVSTPGTNHSVTLNALNANTTYYFVVESKDTAGNTSFSSQYQFTTGASAGGTGTPPSISNINVSSTASSTATITWTTNVSATTKIYVSPSASMNLGTAPSVSDNALVTNHFAVISGLSPNTTYYFIVEARDGSNNVSMSTQRQFTTSS